MILKRIVPVISALMILVCMLAVPASALSTASGYLATPYMDVDLDINIGDNTFLNIGMPPYLPSEDEGSWNCSGDVFCQVAYDTVYDSSSYMISVDAASTMGTVTIKAEPFVTVFDSDILNALISVPYLNAAIVSCSFDAVYVNSDSKPSTIDFNESFVTNGVYNPFRSLNVYDKLHALGNQSALVLIDNFRLSVTRRSASNFHFNLGLHTTDDRPTVSDFLLRNGLKFGEIIREDVDGVGLMQGFADFFSNGVASFLDTDLIGGFSLGDFLTPAICVMFVLVILKMIS